MRERNVKVMILGKGMLLLSDKGDLGDSLSLYQPLKILEIRLLKFSTQIKIEGLSN